MTVRVSAALLDLADRPHVLYRFFDRADVLLYVGITANFGARIAKHARDKPWFDQVVDIRREHYSNRADALTAEKAAIQTEKPLYNDQHNEMTTIPGLTVDEEWLRLNWHDLPAETRRTVEGPAAADAREALAEEILHLLEPPSSSGASRVLAFYQSEMAGGAASWAYGAVMRLQMQLGHADRVIRELLESIPRRDAKICLDWADEQSEFEVPDLPPESRFRSAIEEYTRLLNVRYLTALPERERECWTCLARDMNPHSSSVQIDGIAARYARAFKEADELPDGACNSRYEDQQFCPFRPMTPVHLDECTECEDVCGGHDLWCDDHLIDIVRAARRTGVSEWPDRHGKPIKFRLTYLLEDVLL
ncbi:GIY-YIG nuclease family protein [Catenuloplanes japonicus]|uniref:GIY-YIG nuclease family protein n=1 Tax=Catenuloplanes japonicus TaxID=33876 RepID=UPI00068C81F9|nr:GIY-YIG nuclease family protein [Catenuloplanes japonicus]